MNYKELQRTLERESRAWLVTGAAGFIGSNLVEALLNLNQRVLGLDNFSTGRESNLESVQRTVGRQRWKNFNFVRADISDLAACERACAGVDYVLHQAALGSVPRSIADPVATHNSNVSGFVNMLHAATAAGVKRLVFASSSAVYGDHAALPKIEEQVGNCLSPYAATKVINELYAQVFARCYGVAVIGLRYFNVFGPRQDPDGPYSAVIPKWISSMARNEPVYINGDGETSRDFCYVENVVQANLLAATVQESEAVNQVYNIAVGERITLNQLFCVLRSRMLPFYLHLKAYKPLYQGFRPGDVRHSEADITKARRLLGYEAAYRFAEGIDAALDWYRANLA